MFLPVASCEACQKDSDKLVVTSTDLHPVPAYTTWYHVAIDFIGPISRISLSGYRSVHLFIYFSWYARNSCFHRIDYTLFFNCMYRYILTLSD